MTPAMNPATVTYASGASEAGRTDTAAMSAAAATAIPTTATTHGAGGRLATVQTTTNSSCTPKITTAYDSWVVCAPTTSPTMRSRVNPATPSDSRRRIRTTGGPAAL